MTNGEFKQLAFSTIRNYVNEVWNEMERKEKEEKEREKAKRKPLKYVQ